MIRPTSCVILEKCKFSLAPFGTQKIRRKENSEENRKEK